MSNGSGVQNTRVSVTEKYNFEPVEGRRPLASIDRVHAFGLKTKTETKILLSRRDWLRDSGFQRAMGPNTVCEAAAAGGGGVT